MECVVICLCVVVDWWLCITGVVVLYIDVGGGVAVVCK